jgi:hypothetical protein
MKLAHYLHIAPRTLFIAQGLATLVGAIVQCGVTTFMITRIDNICTPEANGGFTCPHGRVTYSASLIWGESLPPPSETLLTNKVHWVPHGTFLRVRYMVTCFGSSSLDL